jgi:hypothetical protein
MRPLNRVLVACSLCALIGCSIHIGSTEPSVGGGMTGCCSDTLTGQVNYRVAYQSCDDGVFLVLVIDGAGGLSESGGGRGSVGTLDGRRIEWTCETRDGTFGTVTLCGSKYDLSRGGLFLVTARHGQTHIRQVKADLSELKGTVDLDALRAVVRDDAATVSFLDAVAAPKPTPREPGQQ